MPETYANVQNRNLRAFGIFGAGHPVPDGRRTFLQLRFPHLRAAESHRPDELPHHEGSELAVDAGRMDERDARDLIVRTIAALYLNAQSAAARMMPPSRGYGFNTLLKLATDKHDAGTATGVDVLRAQVQLANDKQALLVARNQLKQSLLSLARNLA